MEQVLDIYQRPLDQQRPVVCLDERPTQLLGNVVEGVIKKDGSRLTDYEYRRHGTVQVVMCFAPLLGQRHVLIKQRNTKADWVANVTYLLDNIYRDCKGITLVQDNHSAHKPEAFYEFYSPQKARQYLDRIEFQFTPPHGSWLNMAEFELSVLSRQLLNRRCDNEQELTQHIAKWQQERNQANVKANWRFTTTDARDKLKYLYPQNSTC